MSNTLAIATVTAVLEARINALLNGSGMSSFDVVVDHPRGDAPEPGVYIKVFRVTPNSTLRNDDLPSRRSDGSVSKRPRLALDIDLLLTFVGEAINYDAERLAGLIMTDLHANPSLGRQEIKDYIAGLSVGHVLASADLGDQLERVRFTPLALNVEELSRIWGLFGLSLFGLSVAYQASVVLLDAEVRPSVPLPVLGTGMQVVPSIAPMITSLRSSSASQPLGRIGDTLIIQGTGLRGPSTWLRIGEALIEIAQASAGVDKLTLLLDAPLGLRAGVIGVQVVHRAELGPPADPLRTIARSNAMAFALLPSVLGTPTASGAGPVEVRVEVSPLPEPDQDVVLILDSLAGGGQLDSHDYTIDGAELVFVLPTLSAGDYLVRVQIDGAISQLEIGPAQTFDSPKVTVA